MKCYKFITNIFLLTVLTLILEIELKKTEKIRDFLENSYSKLKTKRESLEEDIKLLEQAQNNIEFLKTKIKSDKAVLISEKKKLLGKVNSFLKIFHDKNLDFPKFKQQSEHSLTSSSSKKQYSDEKIQNLFEKLIPNLKQDNLLEDKKNIQVIKSNSQENNINTHNTTRNINRLPITNINNGNGNGNQIDQTIPEIQENPQNSEINDHQNIDQTNPLTNNEVPPQTPDPNNTDIRDTISNDQPTLPATLTLEKKSSPHSIFDSVDDDPSKSNLNIPITQQLNQTQSELSQLSEPTNNSSEIIGNNTSIDNINANNTDNSTNNTINNVSVFESNSDDENNNNNETVAIISTNLTNDTNSTNYENKTSSMNDTLEYKIYNNSTNYTEINRLADQIKNKNNIMLELKSNNTKNITKKITNQMKRKLNNINSTSSNKTESIDIDKRERIAKFYKAYLEKKKELLKKLQEKDQPPIFNVNEINKVKRLKKKNPDYIKKKYESPSTAKNSNQGVITKEEAVFGPIRIKRKAYDISPEIPHYGYIGQQLIYKNLPIYDMRIYRGINQYENLV